jgi:hypothetical protein
MLKILPKNETLAVAKYIFFTDYSTIFFVKNVTIKENRERKLAIHAYKNGVLAVVLH